jgi:hypothetical protein
MTSAVLGNLLIPRAAEMDCGLPWFTAVFPLFTVVRRTKSCRSTRATAPLTADLASAGVAVEQSKWTV